MDIQLALRSARKFHRSAKPGIAALVRPLNETPRYDVAEIAFLATQLTFATELYLKVGLALHQTVPPHWHSLIDLFNKLHEANRRRLQTSYSLKMSHLTEFTAISLELATRTPDEPPEARTEQEGSKTLIKMLSETGDAYKTWRYLFQAPARPPSQFLISFHHAGLDVLCESMDEHFSPMLTSEAS